MQSNSKQLINVSSNYFLIFSTALMPIFMSLSLVSLKMLFYGRAVAELLIVIHKLIHLFSLNEKARASFIRIDVLHEENTDTSPAVCPSLIRSLSTQLSNSGSIRIFQNQSQILRLKSSVGNDSSFEKYVPKRHRTTRKSRRHNKANGGLSSARSSPSYCIPRPSKLPCIAVIKICVKSGPFNSFQKVGIASASYAISSFQLDFN
jgi:hypothetical protein